MAMKASREEHDILDEFGPAGWREPSKGRMFEADVRDDGSIVVPEYVRQQMELEPGGKVELELTFAGLILRPIHEGRDPEQWWFWSEAWQKGEREVDEDILEGRVMHFDSTEEFFAALEEAGQ